MRNLRPLMLCSALCLILAWLSACADQGRASSAPLPPSELQGRDLRSMDAGQAPAVRAGLAALRQDALPELAQERYLWALGEHWVCAWEINSSLYLELLAPAGGVLWQRQLSLAEGSGFKSLNLGSHRAVEGPVVVIDLSSEQGVSRLYVAVTAQAGLLIRAADQQRNLAISDLAQTHPALSFDTGDLASSVQAQQLAALLSLAQAEQANERQSGRVQGQLARLASSTNTWIAEAAALVLTLP